MNYINRMANKADLRSQVLNSINNVITLQSLYDNLRAIQFSIGDNAVPVPESTLTNIFNLTGHQIYELFNYDWPNIDIDNLIQFIINITGKINNLQNQPPRAPSPFAPSPFAPSPRAPSPFAPSPFAQSVIIPQNIAQIFPSFVINMLLNYDQQSINRISNLITTIYTITDASGNNTYGDILNPGNFRQTYGNLLGGLLGFIVIIVLKQQFVAQLTQQVGQMPILQMNLIDVLYNYQTDDQIIQFYTAIFNNRDTFPESYELLMPMVVTIAQNVLTPPIISSPPVPATNLNSNSRTIDEVNRDLTYLTSLGFTRDSDNETMKQTLRRYKELTGTEYSSPQTTVSREDLEKDLQYLFGLGLTPESGNETLNDRLSKWKQLTGEDYVYNQNPSGGRRRKARKTKTLKRKMRKVRKSRK